MAELSKKRVQVRTCLESHPGVCCKALACSLGALRRAHAMLVQAVSKLRQGPVRKQSGYLLLVFAGSDADPSGSSTFGIGSTSRAIAFLSRSDDLLRQMVFTRCDEVGERASLP
eukprot:15433597-Alexandrium_andersonii.AAC.1